VGQIIAKNGYTGDTFLQHIEGKVMNTYVGHRSDSDTGCRRTVAKSAYTGHIRNKTKISLRSTVIE
jgi:hypothetical protein